MKKIIICLLFSVVIGVFLGIYSFNVFNMEDNINVSNSYNDVYALQIGVFESLENANNIASKYGALIVNLDNKYRVYIAIVNNSLEIIKKYYDDKKIPYYVRKISVSNSFYDYLNSYEEILSASDYSQYDSIISNILKKYKEEL